MTPPPIEHVGATHTAWRIGTSCSDCDERVAERRAALRGKLPQFSIRRLQRENSEGYTQSMISKEIIDEAKRTGREIERPV